MRWIRLDPDQNLVEHRKWGDRRCRSQASSEKLGAICKITLIMLWVHCCCKNSRKLFSYVNWHVCCADVTETTVVEFGDDIASAVLMSDILMNETANRTSVCLSLQFFVNSSVANLTVALSSSLENLTTSTQVLTTRSCHPAHLCSWQETVSVDSGERLFIIANKFRVTRGTVVFAIVADISLTPGNCSSDSTERKFSWSRGMNNWVLLL